MRGQEGLIKQLTATGIVTTADKSGILRAVVITGDTATDKVEIKDGGASGTVRMTIIIPTPATTEVPAPIVIPIPGGAKFFTDIYAVITKSGNIFASFIYDEFA